MLVVTLVTVISGLTVAPLVGQGLTPYQVQGGNRQQIQITGVTPEFNQPEDLMLQASSQDTEFLQPTANPQLYTLELK